MNGASNGRESVQQMARRLGPLGILAALAAMAVAALLLFGASGVVRAALVRASEPGARDAGEKERAEKYAASFDGRLAQIRGRTMFFLPPEPPPPSPPPSEAKGHEPEPDPRPASYSGPAIIAMVNDTVWFDNGKRLVLGEEEAADLVVVSINPPWSARLRWNGVEFDVPLFDRTTPRFLAPDGEHGPETVPPANSSPGEPAEPAAPPPNDPDQKEPE